MKTRLLLSLLSFAVWLPSVQAQRPVAPHLLPNTVDPTAPRTRLEAFEVATSRIIIKGTEDMGFVNCRNGTIALKCVELREPGSNQRLLGLSIAVRQNDGVEDTSTMDHEELDGLLKAVEYISRIDALVTDLNHYEAGLTTPGGFRVATYSSRRTSNREAMVTSNRYNRSRTSLDLTQLAELKLLLEQAQARLYQLAKSK